MLPLYDPLGEAARRQNQLDRWFVFAVLTPQLFAFAISEAIAFLERRIEYYASAR
jgi:hypothetical protein